MKLKRILAGALAAVVSISTVALASLSTASAADPIDADWYGDGAGKLEGAQFKVIQNWNPGTTIDTLSGATEFYVSFDVAADAEGLHAYLIFQDIGNKHSNWNYSADAAAACPAVDCSKAGTYTVGYKGAAITEGFNFLAVAFVDAAGKEYGNDLVPGITLKGVYSEAPTEPEPETTEPETTEPVGPVQENINSIEYNFTVTAGTGTLKLTSQKVGWTNFEGTTEVTGNGDYSIKLTGMDATGLTNLGFIEGTGFAVTMNTIVVNDKYTFEVGESLNTTTANANGLPNIWNDKGKADVVYTATADGKTATLVGSASDKVGITLTVATAAEPDTTEPETTEATTEPETDPQPTDKPQPAGALKAALCFADADWYPQSMEQTDFVEITEDGTYTIKLKAAASDGTLTPIEGAMVFCIDFIDAVVNYPNMTAELVSVACDGGDLEIDPTKALFGNIEDDNNHLRLEIRNEYGNTKADPAVDPSEIYADEELTVTFKVTLDSAPVPSEETTEATTEPATEPCDVTVSLTPDKAYALPGDEVTYTVAVTPNQNLATLQMRMDFPEGLSYVADSFVVDENVKTALGWTDPTETVAWTESTLFLNGFASVADDIVPGTPITLGTFKVVATELGAYTPAFKDYEFCNMDFEGLTYGVAATPVEYVTEIPTEETTEVPTDVPTTEAPTDAPATDPTAAPATTDTPIHDDPTVAPTTAATTASTTAATTAPTTSGNNGNKNDTPNTGAQAAVGLSIFMAAGLAGVVAIKKRRK